MEYYFLIKRNKVLVHATTWISFENMSSERSQTQRSYFTIWFYLYEIFRIGKFIGTENRWLIFKGWESGEWGVAA